MATTEKEKTEETKPKATDFLEKIGRNFNPVNAKELFGGRWVDAMNAVSRAGGHGVEITHDHEEMYKNQLFGGLQIPAGDHFEKRRAEMNAALNDLK